MSQTAVTCPIVAALKGAEMFLDGPLHWTAKNLIQVEFLKRCFELDGDRVAAFKEIESLASANAEEINAFLKAKGFDTALEKFKEGEFGVASVLNILVEWLEKGQKTKLKHADGTEYPAVHLRKNFEVFQHSWHFEPVVRLKTKSGDMLYMTACVDPETKDDGFSLIKKIDEITYDLQPAVLAYGAVIFPMVELDQKVDITWLVGLKTVDYHGYPWEISQAKQQTKFRMNEVGARAESAVATRMRGITAARPGHTLVINDSFLLWIERPGLSQPLFTAHITPDHWKEPTAL